MPQLFYTSLFTIDYGEQSLASIILGYYLKKFEQ